MVVAFIFTKRKNLKNPENRIVEVRHCKTTKWDQISINYTLAIVSIAKGSNGSNGAPKQRNLKYHW